MYYVHMYIRNCELQNFKLKNKSLNSSNNRIT